MDRLVEKLRVEGEGVRFTSQDCTRYGGYPVALIHLDELPYWAELVDNRLGFAQEMERQRELARVLKAFYSSLPPLGEYTWTAQEQEIEEVAKEYVKETGSQIRWFLPAGETVLGQSGLKFLFVHSLSSLKEGRVCLVWVFPRKNIGIVILFYQQRVANGTSIRKPVLSI